MKQLITMLVIIFTFMESNLLLAAEAMPHESQDSTSRFILRNGGEAFDKVTKLTWRRCSVGTTWQEGDGCIGLAELMTLAEAKNFASQVGEGWRVPTIEELYSLVEPESYGPAINASVFPDIEDSSEGAPYWSVTPVEEIPILIYFVDFISGRVDGHSDGFAMAVRLVRDTQ